MNVRDWLTELATGVSWLGTKLKFSTVCCREELLAVELLITNLGPKSSLLQGSKVTHITFIHEIAAREWFIDMNVSGCFNDHLNKLWCHTRGASWFFLSLPPSDTHTQSLNTHLHLSYPWYKIGFKAFEIRLFFLPSLSFLFSRSLPLLFLCCFLPLGFCVVNGGESLRDDKGRDATLGKLSVKDRGRDGWRGWVHERRVKSEDKICGTMWHWEKEERVEWPVVLKYG